MEEEGDTFFSLQYFALVKAGHQLVIYLTSNNSISYNNQNSVGDVESVRA